MTSPSVLIIRLDGIGDALALTPLLAALRERSVPCDVVLQESNAGVFSTRAVRRIVCARFALRSDARDDLREIAALGAELAQEGYTHALVATEDPSGYRLAKAVEAPHRVGFANGWGKPFKTLWTHAFLTQRIYRAAGLDRRAPHECEVLFRLGRGLLGEAAPSREVGRLRPLVIEREPPVDDRVAVQITDKWLRLDIATATVIELVERLRRATELRLIAPSHEDAYARVIERAVAMEVERFDRLEPWKAAIAAARALVAPDSGAMHVAGMAGTPVVAVFPPSRGFAMQVARWAPWASPHRIVGANDGWPVQAADALAQLLERSRF